MSYIRFENVSKSFAGQPVLESVSLRIEEREHVGLIGRNGTGKSTIFRLMTGETEPDGGMIERMRKLRFATLAQLHRVDDNATIFDIVLHAFDDLLQQERRLAELEERMAEGDESVLDEYADVQEQFSIRGGYDFRSRIKQVLQGLGFIPDEFDLPFHALSGGQRTRLMLALVLLQDADMLLLDEPENHLDLEAREWLESYLKECRQAVLIISHDRRMLNSVVDRILDLERGEVRSYTGNYDSFVEQKDLYIEQQQAAFERQQEHIRKEMVWINRFRYKATKAKQAQSRLKRLDKLERVDAPAAEAQTAAFKLGEVVRSGAVMLDARDLSMGYGDLVLYSGVSFQVQRGERVGIIGPNGAGKTTLLRQLAGQHTGRSGEVILGHKVRIGVYDQNHESMNRSADILTEVLSAKPEWTPEQIRSFLGGFLFFGNDAFKSISSLSGGELSRVAMAKLILGGANLLMLDEPTNHLDIASREALEVALSEYPGAFIMISHDRALIDRLVDKLVVIQNGRAEVHLGNYSHYRWKKQEEAAEAEARSTEDVLKIRRAAPPKEEKKPAKAAARPNLRKVEQLEERIAAKEEEIKAFEARFAAIDPADYAQVHALTGEYDRLKAEVHALYAEWEALSN